MSVYDRIQSGEYQTRLVTPQRPREPAILTKRAGDLTAAEIASLPQVRQDAEHERAEFNQARRLLAVDRARLTEQFRKDLEEEFGTEGHPKADILFSKAWDRSHGEGLANVYLTYQDLAELLDLSPRPEMSPTDEPRSSGGLGHGLIT